MRPLTLLPLFAIGSLLPAQQPATTSANVFQAPANQNCPVGLEASHSKQGGLRNVGPSTGGAKQAYELRFSSEPYRPIAQAVVTMYGLAGSQFMPARNVADTTAAESFHVVPASGPNHRFRSTVNVTKLTAVQWVELKEVTYADGSKWTESPSASCLITPNGFMLVAQH